MDAKAKARRGDYRQGEVDFEAFVYPSIRQRPINEVTAAEILRVLRSVESQGFQETAHRARQRISQVLRYATVTGRADRDVTHELRGALTAVPTKHRAAIIDPKKVGELLRAIDGYEGQPAAAYALRLAPLLFVRPGELRAAEWDEFDVDAKEPVWRIPAAKMKSKVQHIVPLATQVVALLGELRPLTSYSKYLFPVCARRIGVCPMRQSAPRFGGWVSPRMKHRCMDFEPPHRRY